MMKDFLFLTDAETAFMVFTADVNAKSGVFRGHVGTEILSFNREKMSIEMCAHFRDSSYISIKLDVHNEKSRDVQRKQDFIERCLLPANVDGDVA